MIFCRKITLSPQKRKHFAQKLPICAPEKRVSPTKAAEFFVLREETAKFAQISEKYIKILSI